MPKQSIDGTQIAVKSPSCFCPENHKYPDMAKEINTARRMKKSDGLNIINSR
jgi:hypothetical protein